MASETTELRSLPPEVDDVHALAWGDRSPDGEGDRPITGGQAFELLGLIAKLKARREAKGLSVATLSRRSGLSVEAIEGLEGRRNLNPRFDLVWRYALAMDALPTLSIEEVEPGPEEIEERAGEITP